MLNVGLPLKTVWKQCVGVLGASSIAGAFSHEVGVTTLAAQHLLTHCTI